MITHPFHVQQKGWILVKKSCFVIFDYIQKNIAFILKSYKTYFIDIYIFNKKHIHTISHKSIISQEKW
jgi:hypothetical protein